MGSFDIEICSNCRREIARSEQAYVFEGNIVCTECNNTLRSGPLSEPSAAPEPVAEPELVTVTEPQPKAPSLSKEDEQEKDAHSQDAEKPAGFIIAGVVLCLLGIGLINIGFVGLAAFFLGGFLIGILMAGGCLTSGMLILILGIAAIIVGAISRQHLLR